MSVRRIKPKPEVVGQLVLPFIYQDDHAAEPDAADSTAAESEQLPSGGDSVISWRQIQ